MKNFQRNIIYHQNDLKLTEFSKGTTKQRRKQNLVTKLNEQQIKRRRDTIDELSSLIANQLQNFSNNLTLK